MITEAHILFRCYKAVLFGLERSRDAGNTRADVSALRIDNNHVTKYDRYVETLCYKQAIVQPPDTFLEGTWRVVLGCTPRRPELAQCKSRRPFHQRMTGWPHPPLAFNVATTGTS